MCIRDSSYVVKVVNPNGKGGYQLHPLDSRETFKHVQELKDCILDSCKEYIESKKELHFDYIVPGHGKKGKQIEVNVDSDLQEMYQRYTRGTEIVLWMKQTASRKRPRTPAESEESTSAGRKSKRSSCNRHLEIVAEVDEIYDKLSDKHGEKYTCEQYRCWANLIQLQKHDSYETPPKKRFFKERVGSNGASSTSGVSPPRPTALHPLQRMRCK